MGPRLFRRGNTGAIPFSVVVRCGFNGATSFQTWKQVKDWPIKVVLGELQWGHVFSDVETCTGGANTIGIGQLQWGHVFSDVETSNPAWYVDGDNKLQWGHVFSDVETLLTR